MRMSCCSVLAMLAIASSGCEQRFTSVGEYEKFVKGNDSPYMQQVVKDGIKVSVRYLPTDELLIQNYRQIEELKKRATMDTSASLAATEQALLEAEDELSKARKLYENSIYFALTLGFEDGKHDIEYEPLSRGFQVYSEWTQRLQFGLNEYITLEARHAGEIPLSLYRMERTFGITKDRAFLLSFPEKFNGVHIRQSDVTLHLHEFGLNTGSLSFDIDTKNTVRLILNKNEN